LASGRNRFAPASRPLSTRSLDSRRCSR
jgi:hypothetical protein